MPARISSPAPSETGPDLTEAITGEIFQNGSRSRITRELEECGLESNRAIISIPDLGANESDDASFIAVAQTAANRKSSAVKGTGVKRGGGFQSFGLSANVLKAISRKGFSVPTPIQRKTIPLIQNNQDVVGMARTGSGKTAAFVLPMVEKLKGHSPKMGARALILSPSRELALQTLKVVKEFSKGSDLRSALLVGGDSLEEQFGIMASNPDVIIATPGRFLHLKVEMGLDLSSIRYVVFDEADRLFEMGFAAQLTEILHALPTSRQTLLFSATLPKSLVEFARAGLQEPHLVRLDSEGKISQDLQSVFLTLKSAEMEGALLHILQDVIEMPTGSTESAGGIDSEGKNSSRKRKRGEENTTKAVDSPTKHSTIIFAATKHRVEYLATLLRQFGFAVSYAYGSLDQTARKTQVQDFRSGMTNILVVTDVAARGIDIPVLANVINYDFPTQPKIFVHRVGRTARAGQKGWSYSLVRDSDAPYLLDLQLFLGKRLLLGDSREDSAANYTDDVVIGGMLKEQLQGTTEWVTKLLDEDVDLAALRSVAAKGDKLYLKSRNAASTESVRRAKNVATSHDWYSLHPIYQNQTDSTEANRAQMLARVSAFKPQETIFEIGKRGTGGEIAEIVKKRRATVEARRKESAKENGARDQEGSRIDVQDNWDDKPHVANDDDELPDLSIDMSSASSDDLEVTFNPSSSSKNSKGNFEDPSFFMSYIPANTNLAEDRALGVHSGSTANDHFLTAARSAAMDLNNDEGGKGFGEASRTSKMRWDKKNKKYVARANDEDGSKGAKFIRGESGQKIAASFRSGRYDAWKRSNRTTGLPRVGEAEKARPQADASTSGRRWKHHKSEAPKQADKYRDDFYKRKKKVEAAKEARRGRFTEGAGKREIKGTDEVRKDRRAKEMRREKTGRGKKPRTKH